MVFIILHEIIDCWINSKSETANACVVEHFTGPCVFPNLIDILVPLLWNYKVSLNIKINQPHYYPRHQPKTYEKAFIFIKVNPFFQTWVVNIWQNYI